MGLAQQLLDLEAELIALIDATTNAKRRKRLITLRKKISKEAARLIDAALDDSTAEYKKVTANLEKASAAARKAIDDVNSVQAAINTVAKLVDLASKIIV